MPTHLILSPPSHSNTLSEEKRRMEGRLSTLEEDLEEEQMNIESALDKARKAQEQADGMSTDIAANQSTISKLEKAKAQLEKQVSRRSLMGGCAPTGMELYLCCWVGSI
jgi:peptidoglycan hydrolase CwlO-like protein